MKRQKNISLLKKILLQNQSQKIDSFSVFQTYLTQNTKKLKSDQLNKNNQKVIRHDKNSLKNVIQQIQLLEIDLKLQSKVNQKDQHINCLLIQSKCMAEQDRRQENGNLFLQSRIQMNKKLQVHSSINSFETLKQSENKTNKSIPLSDLILSDNDYIRFKISPQTNSNMQIIEVERLRQKYYANLKIITNQTVEMIEIVEAQLDWVHIDQLVQNMTNRVTYLRNQIHNSRSYFNSNRVNFNQSSHRSKTPQLKRPYSPRNYEFNLMKNQQILQTKLKNQRQKSIKLKQRLSQTKNKCKLLQLKNDKQNKRQSPNQITMASRFTDKSKTNRLKHYQFLQRQKNNYFQALKKHKQVIQQSVYTYKQYERQKVKQLETQIRLMKQQSRYLDVKYVENNFFLSPKTKNTNQGKQKSYKKSMFSNNYSQKSISNCSSNKMVIKILSSQSPKMQSPTSIEVKAVKSRNINKATKSPNRIVSKSPLSHKLTPNHHVKNYLSPIGKQNIYS